MNIRLFNTMSRKLEDFKPLTPGKMGFYSCGPTVYWNQHLGNMRTFINNDLIKRMFIENGYEVKHVMNYTDVGHLTSDEDEGEDKMEKGAARENKTVWEIAKQYIDSVESDFRELNIIKPITPRATEYIEEQINLVKQLEEAGYTYIIPGKGVYYDTSKFADYGALGGQDLNQLRAGARIDDSGKRNPTDFMLWAFSTPEMKRAMEWESPWGIGWPGWHIECSAMSKAILGDHFDIHTGGQEHIKVHHSDEIAQSEPLVGKPWVSYWVHYAWLMAKDGKMSKSAGDALTVPYIKSKGYDPMDFRYLMLLGHYRQPIEFSWNALDAAATGYKNLVRKIADLLGAEQGCIDAEAYNTWHDKILTPVSDNLKTAESLVIVQEMLKDTSINSATKIALFEFIDRLLGLQFIDRAKKLRDLESIAAPDEIITLAQSRTDAKAAKDWTRADALRAEIDAAGWTVTDTKDGFKLVKKA